MSIRTHAHTHTHTHTLTHIHQGFIQRVGGPGISHPEPNFPPEVMRYQLGQAKADRGSLVAEAKRYKVQIKVCIA